MQKEIEDLQEVVSQNEFKITEADYYKNILGDIYDKGIINKKGNLI